MTDKQHSGMSVEEIEKKYMDDYQYFLDRVRRHVPAPADLLWRLDKAFTPYANLLDAKSKEPLFSKKARKEWRNLRNHIANGCLSDHPDIPLYFDLPRRENGRGPRCYLRLTEVNNQALLERVAQLQVCAWYQRS